MGVQVAAQVALGDQLRQPGAAVGGGLELAAVLPQLRLDVGQAQRGVDRLLAGALERLAGGVVEHAVLRHVQAAPHGRLAQRHVVRARAGEVLEQVAELLGRDDAQVDLDARCGSGPARRRCPMPATDSISGSADERLDQRVRVGRRGDDVEVLAGVGHAPRRAGQLDLGRTRDARAAPRRSARRPPARGRAPRGARPRRPAWPRARRGCSPRPWARSPSACAGARPRPPRAARRASRCPAPRRARAPAWARGPAAASSATSPAGNFARSFTAAGISSCSTRARIFSCRVLPTPASSVARPSRASAATEVEASRTLCAAVRYATTRWTIAPSSSYRSPSSARASAMSLFVGSAMVGKEIG